MTTPAQDQAASDMGVYAAQAIENPALNAAIAHMRDAIMREWRACNLRDAEGQRLLLQQAKMVDRFAATLNGMLQAGKLADARLGESQLARIMTDDLRDESAVRRMFRRGIRI